MSGFDAAEVGRRVLRTEAEALGLMADGLDGAFSRAVETVHGLKGQLVCTGVGKSGHVARKISATDRLARSPPVFATPRERRSAASALLRPIFGVSAGAAARGVDPAGSALPGCSITAAVRFACGEAGYGGTGSGT